MANINYIASAGTGKTYSLVSEVIDKIRKEDVSLRQILILTFTEKAAAELKEKISERIKEALKDPNVSKKEKIKLHRQLLFIDSGYIGTFHSIFFRFLKKYPHVSGIDKSFSVLSSQLDYILGLFFEKWIEKDFEENPKDWEKIITFFTDNEKKLKKIFLQLYKERLKLKKPDINFNNQEKSIKELANQLKGLIDEFFNKYSYLFPQAEKFWEINLNAVLHKLNSEDLQNLPSIKPEKAKIFKKPKKLTEEEKIFYKKNIKPLSKDKEFLNFQENIINTLYKLKIRLLDYNANLLLNKIWQFISFVENIKKEEKIIDFDDILEKTLEMIKSKPSIKEQIKNSFKYIFIDEFQDTDNIQTQIIKEISNNNIYVFGDPKQCIYTWRNADLNVYFDFLNENTFSNEVIDTNYRSEPELVEFFNKMLSDGIILNYLDCKFRQNLKANKDGQGKIKLIDLKLDKLKNNEIVEIEAKATTGLIKKLKQQGYDYKDIMILFRKNNHLYAFEEILKSYNIPTSVPEGENIFETPEVKTLINILKLIEFPKRKIGLLKVLKSPLVLLEDEKLYENKDSLSVNELNIDNFNTINEIIKDKYNLAVEEIIDKIYQDTDLLESFSLLDKNGQILENLKKFKLIAKQKTRENFSLRDFILFTETAVISEAQAFSENAVQLLTMHKSKGLQNKVVIIPLISIEPDQLKTNSINIYKNEVLLNFPYAKSEKMVEYEEQLKENISQEWERLFYVAITRAERKLIFIKSKKSGSRSFGKFIDEFLKKNKSFIEIEKLEPNFDNLDAILETRDNLDLDNIEEKLEEILKKEKKQREIYEKSLTSPRFTSVSQIMKEEKEREEIKFNFSKNTGENISIYTGIVVHNVLEEVDFTNISLKQLNTLIKKQEKIIPELIKNVVMENSRKILRKFINSPLHKELKESNIIFRELPFTLYENEKYIEGRIDIIYEKDGKIIVMDYKTNRYETEEEKQKVIKAYEKQKEYYLKAVKKVFPEKNIEFKLGLLWKGEVV